MSEKNRIVYVEDDDDIREVGLLALEHVGQFDVLACASGEEAVDKAVDFKPDLVLLDVMMPGMDGIETFERLRQKPELSAIPIVFMTAKVHNDEVARYREMGANGVIPKPFEPMTLCDEIRLIMDRHYHD